MSENKCDLGWGNVSHINNSEHDISIQYQWFVLNFRSYHTLENAFFTIKCGLHDYYKSHKIKKWPESSQNSFENVMFWKVLSVHDQWYQPLVLLSKIEIQYLY